MKVENLRSPNDKVGGIVYFGRMLDKIRLHAQGKLPPDYHENLGKAFDDRCVKLLGVSYVDLVARTKMGGADEEILGWCFEKGRKPGEDDVMIWNNFMSKRGWRDEASEVLKQRKEKFGLSQRQDVQTFFDLIDADEGRLK